jgi:hypothetical protein
MPFVRGWGPEPLAGGSLLGGVGRASPASWSDGNAAPLCVLSTGIEAAGVGGGPALGTDGLSGAWAVGGALEPQPSARTKSRQQLTDGG